MDKAVSNNHNRVLPKQERSVDHVEVVRFVVQEAVLSLNDMYPRAQVSRPVEQAQSPIANSAVPIAQKILHHNVQFGETMSAARERAELQARMDQGQHEGGIDLAEKDTYTTAPYLEDAADDAFERARAARATINRLHGEQNEEPYAQAGVN